MQRCGARSDNFFVHHIPAKFAILLRLGRPVLVAEDHIGFAGRVFTTYTFCAPPIRLSSSPMIATCLLFRVTLGSIACRSSSVFCYGAFVAP
jgi:hypothetical protein